MPAVQAVPSSSMLMAVIARVRASLGSPTDSYSPVVTSKRRRPGAPAAHRKGGLTAMAVIGPDSARSLIEKPVPGPAAPVPRPAWQPATVTSAPNTRHLNMGFRSYYSPAVWRDLILVATMLAADRTSLPLQPGRTTNVVVGVDVGAPLERAVPGKFYAQAAAADGEQRWA